MKQNEYIIRKKVWKILAPLFPFLRIKFGFLRHLRYVGRETYPIGYLKKELSLDYVESELQKIGFEKYYVAWLDQGEILGMRKSEGFEKQYHVRIFNDYEVRGHFELTPEYSAFKHFFDFGKTANTKDFIKMIGRLLQ